MKRKDFFKILGTASAAATLGGCSGFLDQVPDEKHSLKDAFTSRSAALDSLYSCYSFIPSQRSIRTIASLSDNMSVVPFTQEKPIRFPEGNYSPSNPYFPIWKDIYKGLRHCYIFINRVHKVRGLNLGTIKDFKAQAKFIIGYLAFYGARMYGPLILQDSVPSIETAPKDFKKRATFEETVRFVTDTLDEAANDLPAKRYGNEYGLATSVMAKAVKAKMLLYAASPLFNGGGENKTSPYANFKDTKGNLLIPIKYRRNKWKKAADALKQAIDIAESVGHQLYHYNESVGSVLPKDPVEKDLRFIYCDSSSKEVIFPDTRKEGIYDYQNNAKPFYSGGGAWNSLSPTLSMLETFYTENGLPIDKDPNYNYGNRYSISKGPNGKTVALNLNREPRFNAWICYHNSYFEIKSGDELEVLCQFRKFDNCGMQGRANNYSPTGYLVKKGVHPLSSRKEVDGLQQYPWPNLRLGELYLDYAEALIGYGQKLGEAKQYIDKIRTRAGIPTVDDAWNPIGGADDKKMLRSIVRRERTIELYLESELFWDLRRWMEAVPALDHRPKGMNINGETLEEYAHVTEVKQNRAFHVPSNYLMPIPIGQINKDVNMVQNLGY